MRDSLIEVIKELEEFDDATRVQEAGVLQDELREAMGLVATIRSAAAQAAVTAATGSGHGLAGAASLADTSPQGLLSLARRQVAVD